MPSKNAVSASIWSHLEAQLLRKNNGNPEQLSARVLQLHSEAHYNIPVFISSCMAKWTQGQPNREEKGLT